MTISPNEGTERTEVLYGIENTTKTILDFYQEQPKVGICTLIIHGHLYQWELICLRKHYKILKEEGVIPSFIDTIADPNGIQKTIFDLIQTADHEILITFPTANAFHRRERLGVIKLLEASECNHQNSDTCK